MNINEAVHVTLFHVGEGRKQDGRGRGGGADKKFTRKGTVSTKRVRTRGAFRKFEDGDGKESRNT